MTQVEIEGMIEMLWADERKRIDLSMVIEILSRKGYSKRNQESEMQRYFQIFDCGDKGYINLDDLKRVQKEAIEAEREMNVASNDRNDVEDGAVDDATLQAMINCYENLDGVLSYEEFKSILEPVLSSSVSR